MTFEIGLTLAAIIFLLAMSAFFNASETSLTACSKARMHSLAEEGSSRAKLVNKLMANPERLLGAVLLGNTLVDVLAASLASSLAITMVGDVFNVGISFRTTVYRRDAVDGVAAGMLHSIRTL